MAWHRPARLTTLATLALLGACPTVEGDAPLGAGEPTFHEWMFENEELSAGDTTVFVTGNQSYSLPSRNLSTEKRREFFVGNSFFNRNWVTAPASTEGRDGLGPTFHARSCSGCHFLDGRGRPPANPADPLLTLVVDINAGLEADGAPIDDPAYGHQLQPYGLDGVPGEGFAYFDWEEVPGEYGDGEPYILRKPTLRVDGLQFGPMSDDTLMSARVARQVTGMGLLDKIDQEDILALEDPDDDDGDGISGRANWVTDVLTGERVVGRFGWKATRPTLEEHIAGAFLGDIGITSAHFPAQNCPTPQVDCANAYEHPEPELDDSTFGRVSQYVHHLAPPARRDLDDDDVIRGKELFIHFGCVKCHYGRFDTPEVAAWPELGGQTIHPFTDMLLHDMGEGLADGQPVWSATGREWRTAPLWGIGLQQDVSNHLLLLHDGRARGFAEAVLWHGGEAELARESFRLSDASARHALLRFLESL